MTRPTAGRMSEAGVLRTVPCRLLNANPLIAVVDEFLDGDTRNTLISLARDRMERAAVLGDDACPNISPERTNSECSLTPEDGPGIGPLLEQLADVVGLPVSHSEGISILHYAPTEEFKLHADGISSGVAPKAIEAFKAEGGQRLFTTMIYLNTVEDGGGTAFSWLGFRVATQQGRLLFFANTPAGDCDQSKLAAHAGEPVVVGEKWVAVTWWRERPYQPSG